jgi:Asp-tRNAAsn/Glu-tRNAGln amidotransferase A subunit and related amidases
MEYANEFLRIAKSSLKASEFVGRTVVRLNQDALNEAAEIIENRGRVITLGTKDTGQISRKLIKRLIDTKKYVWHTIDGMAQGGRAVDIELINPLTSKPMTGSSSATAINVLYGINDAGIGTDGGGSILAPALSLNLYSIMAKGMGLKGSTDRISTDGISFTPGIGVISHSLKLARETICGMLGTEDDICFGNIKVAVCKEGSITLPDGRDMNGKLTPVLNILRDNGIDVYKEELPDFMDRKDSILKIKELFQRYDIVITCEGPVDLVGLGDSVFGTMGQFAGESQKRSGKYMVKIANMLNATSVSIPIDEAASGIVVTSRNGITEGMKAIKLAEMIGDLYRMPELYYNYFKDGYLRKRNDLIFSMEGV